MQAGSSPLGSDGGSQRACGLLRSLGNLVCPEGTGPQDCNWRALLITAFVAFRAGDLVVLAGWLAAVAGTATIIDTLWQPGEKRSEATVLHAGWARLGTEYEELWSRTYGRDAPAILQELDGRGEVLSERAKRLPHSEARMNRRLEASAARVHPHFESYASREE